MRRSDFLRLCAAAATAAWWAPLSNAAAVPAPPGIARWAACYGAALSRGAEGIRLRAAIRCADLGAALRALGGLADGPLHCDGNGVTGASGDTRFRVEITLA